LQLIPITAIHSTRLNAAQALPSRKIPSISAMAASPSEKTVALGKKKGQYQSTGLPFAIPIA
jgi:hypothetical protein